MSWRERKAWLICYDIAHPRRIQQVHKLLSTCCLWIQYSVFAAWLSEREMKQLMANLEMLIDFRKDDIRIYPLPAHCETIALGARLLPAGIILPDHQLLRLLAQH